MIRYIPDFVLQKYEAQQLKGEFQGFVLLIDIAGFTQISTDLQQHGSMGAEVLSNLLGSVLEQTISTVSKYGGFVSLFAGDAICTIFTEADAACIVAAAHTIRDKFQDFSFQSLTLGAFQVRLRQTVSYGALRWEIFENDIQNEYVFYGEPITELSQLALTKEELAFSKSAILQIGEAMLSPCGDSLKEMQVENTPLPCFTNYTYLPETKHRFIRADMVGEHPANEIRDASFCFASFGGVAPENRAAVIGILHELLHIYGGIVNKLDTTEKGLVAILLFGLPQSLGKTLDRMCQFVLELQQLVPNIAIGMSCGKVYAGYIGIAEAYEYTALGYPMNLAARLMGKAQPGEILTDYSLWRDLKSRFEFNYLGKLSMKGFLAPIQYYRLDGWIQDAECGSGILFVGRHNELDRAHNIIDQAIANRGNSIVYVSGDPGIGKTRFAREVINKYQIQGMKVIRVTCDALLNRPLDAVKQIVRAEFVIDHMHSQEDRIAQYRKQWVRFGQDLPLLNRIESIIASLLGIEWAGSLWSKLPGDIKNTQLKQAFRLFMEQLCSKAQVIMFLDDGQWLDAQSTEFLQDISEHHVKPLIIVSPCRYLEKGQKVNLNLAHHPLYDLELDDLNREECYELIQSILCTNQVSGETMELIYHRALGNPLFIEQVTLFLSENHMIDFEGRVIGNAGNISTFSVSDIIGNRIDKLTDKVRECVLHASVLGSEFNVKILSQMMKFDVQSEVIEGIDNRIWKEINELRYIFSHIMIRNVAYSRMLSEKLTRLHYAAAEAMEHIYVDSLQEYAEEIAYHYLQADNIGKAAYYYDLAGDYFWGACQHEQSEKCYAEAIRLQAILGETTADYAESIFHLGLLYHYLGIFEKAEAIYLQVFEINTPLLGLDSPLLSPYINNLGRLYKDMGRYAESEELLTKSLEIEIANLPDSSNVADRLNNLGHLYSKQKEFAKALPIYQESVRLMGAKYSTHPYYGSFINNLAVTYMELDRFEEAEPLVAEAMIWSIKAYGEDNPNVTVLYYSTARIQQRKGDYMGAEQMLLKGLAVNEAIMGINHARTMMFASELQNMYLVTNETSKAEELKAKMGNCE